MIIPEANPISVTNMKFVLKIGIMEEFEYYLSMTCVRTVESVVRAHPLVPMPNLFLITEAQREDRSRGKVPDPSRLGEVPLCFLDLKQAFNLEDAVSNFLAFPQKLCFLPMPFAIPSNILNRDRK